MEITEARGPERLKSVRAGGGGDWWDLRVSLLLVPLFNLDKPEDAENL